MTGKEYKYILNTIENEGFDYAFVNYSDFEEIKDPMFHQLRKDYLFARKVLKDYVGDEDS